MGITGIHEIMRSLKKSPERPPEESGPSPCHQHLNRKHLWWSAVFSLLFLPITASLLYKPGPSLHWCLTSQLSPHPCGMSMNPGCPVEPRDPVWFLSQQQYQMICGKLPPAKEDTCSGCCLYSGSFTRPVFSSESQSPKLLKASISAGNMRIC